MKNREIMNCMEFGKHTLLIITIFCILISLSSCGNEVNDSTTNEHLNTVSSSKENDELLACVERYYNAAENPTYATYVSHRESTGSGSASYTYDITFKDGSNAGYVYYQTISNEVYPNGLVCLYISDEKNNVASLKLLFVEDYKAISSTYSTTLANPEMKGRCYCEINDNYIIVVNISEESEGIYNNHSYLAYDENSEDVDYNNLNYNENITVYALNENIDTMLKIDKNITPSLTNDIKAYTIRQGNSEWAYASGYSSYSNSDAVLLSTEQEFCDKANEMLTEYNTDSFFMSKCSWNNRWYDMSIDESGIGFNMARIDYAASCGIINESDDVVSDIEIKINDKTQDSDKNVVLEEIDDSPVTYNQPDGESNENVVMPDNVPSSINASDLQNIKYFNLDGYWHSEDLRYVFRIFTQEQNPLNEFSYVDLYGSRKNIYGKVKALSSYSILLKPHEDNAKSFELFAVNNQLKSDDITLIKADNSTVNKLIGTWANSTVTYTFQDDGDYKVKKTGDSYWGMYFVIDETSIVLGEHVEDMRIYSYKITGNTLVINDSITLTRQ